MMYILLAAVLIKVGSTDAAGLIQVRNKNVRTNTSYNSQGTSIKPLHSHRTMQDLYNVTIYLGYANNPFGYSTLAHKKYDKSHTKSTAEESNSSDLLENLINQESTSTNSESRLKRGVVHLYNMVSCATGCNPLIYKGYGCYCGFLGSGRPVDAIDRCCKQHDWCYNNSNCPLFLEYIVPYFWKCWHGRPLCAVHHGKLGGPGSCASRLCECDRILSECLRKFPCPSSRARCTSSPWRLLQNTLMIL